jgi:hypothetical protein
MLVPRDLTQGRLSTGGCVTRGKMSRRRAAARQTLSRTRRIGSRHDASRATTGGARRPRATRKTIPVIGARRCAHGRAALPKMTAVTGTTAILHHGLQGDAKSETDRRRVSL